MSSTDPPTGTPLFHLPNELLDNIYDHVDELRDRLSFASTCKALEERFYLLAVLFNLELHTVLSHGGKWEPPLLFCLLDALEGQPGYGPFFISSVRLSAEGSRSASPRQNSLGWISTSQLPPTCLSNGTNKLDEQSCLATTRRSL